MIVHDCWLLACLVSRVAVEKNLEPSCAGTCIFDTATINGGACTVDLSSVHPRDLEEWQGAKDSITTCSEQDLTVMDPMSGGGLCTWVWYASFIESDLSTLSPETRVPSGHAPLLRDTTVPR